MVKIYLAIKEFNVVIFATPLYYWNMNAKIRTAVDRLFAPEYGDGNLQKGGKA